MSSDLDLVRSKLDRPSKLFLIGLMGISSLILFSFSSLQLWLFRAGNDLAFFDQFMYLLSRGVAPVSTLLEGVHLIGDHGAVILYLLALPYFIYPSVYWLLAVQAIALSGGVLPVYALSREYGLSVAYSKAIACCYILYPAIFNINFYTEFRPEVIAVPALLWSVWAAKKKLSGQFAIAIILTLSCKENISLTIIGLGIWLAFLERRVIYGLFCLFSGVAWFILAAEYLIPTFRGEYPMAGTWHYQSLGNSMTEIAGKVLTNPQILLIRALASDRLFYYLLLVLPILLGLHWSKISAIVPALPMLGLNILADFPRQRDLIHQYSLPIIPFLFVWLIISLAYLIKNNQRLWLSRKLLITWSIVAWLALAKYGYFWTHYAPLFSNVAAVNRAVSLVESDARVITSGYVAPHLSHRPMIKLLNGQGSREQIEKYQLDTVLITEQHLGLETSKAEAKQIIQDLLESSKFNLVYHQQDVFLLKKTAD
jgi:uncharacterized membrane protein